MGGCGGTFLGISGIERRGRREIEQPKVGPKGELSGSERVNSEFLSSGWGQSQFYRSPDGVSPNFISFLVLSGHREGKVTGFLGLTESRPLGKIENRKLGGAEDRLPEGSPKGAASGMMQVKDCRRQPAGRAERERTSQPKRSAATSQHSVF